MLYIPLFLALRGNLVVSQSDRPGGWPRVSFESTAGLAWEQARDVKSRMRTAQLMLVCVPFPTHNISLFPSLGAECCRYPLIFLITARPVAARA